MMDERTSRAIAHLAEALHLLACVRDQDEPATVPVTIGDNQIVVTAKTAEALADAVDSMNSYLDDEHAFDDTLRAAFQEAQPAIDALLDNDEASAARRLAEMKERAQAGNGEQITSGEWTAAAVAQKHTDLYAEVTDLFMLLDPIEITDKVIRDREADLAGVAQVLDELYGDVPYPYAEEDVPLPHDQAHMDALLSEVESYLQDGDR